MDYCAGLGIPHSKFLEWSDEDREKALGHMVWKRSLCQGCGTDPSEWLDADGEAVEPPPYEATTHTCLGCATLEEERDRLRQDGQTSHRYHTFLKRFSGRVDQWQMRRSQSD